MLCPNAVGVRDCILLRHLPLRPQVQLITDEQQDWEGEGRGGEVVVVGREGRGGKVVVVGKEGRWREVVVGCTYAYRRNSS